MTTMTKEQIKARLREIDAEMTAELGRPDYSDTDMQPMALHAEWQKLQEALTKITS